MYQEYLTLKGTIDELKKQLVEMERKIYGRNASTFNAKDEGQITIKEEGFKVTVTKRMGVKVDQKVASTCPGLFRVKYELDKKKYKEEMDCAQKQKVDEAITLTPGKPGFKVERIEE